MLSLRLTLIASACVLALSACSSSSGGGESNSSLFITQDPYKNQSTNSGGIANNSNLGNNPSSDTASSSGSNSAGNLAIFSSSSFTASPNPVQLSGAIVSVKAETPTVSNLKNTRDEELNELLVGNTHIRLFSVYDLLDPEQSLDKFKPLTDNDVIDGRTGTASGYVGGFGNIFSYSGFHNTRFGVYRADNVDHLFVQGYVTPLTERQRSRNGDLDPMPSAGRYTYRIGQALYGQNGEYEQLSASVVADFDTDKLNVNLNGTKTNLSFSANISGNGFEGNDGGIQSKGLFYGDQAEEIGGIFYRTEGSEKGKGGVFGARSPRRDAQ